MQTEVNYDLLSRSDSMKRMTIRNMDSELQVGVDDEETKKMNRI